MRAIAATRFAGLGLAMTAASAVAAGPIRTERGAPIVEIRDGASLENYVCPACVPADLTGLALPPGFVVSTPRSLLADFGEVRRVPGNPGYATLDVGGFEFQMVARVRGGLAGIQIVSPGTIVRLASDRTLRLDAGREILMLDDGAYRWILFAASDALDPATLALPAGWSLSTRMLAHDFVLFDPTGFPYVYVDAQENLWQRLTVDPDALTPEPRRLAGKRLALTDRADAAHRRRLVFALRASDLPTPASGAPDDPSVAGAWMIVRNEATGEEDTFDLPAVGWRGVGSPAGVAGCRYRDGRREHGPCRKVVVKRDAKVVATCVGADVDVTLDEPAQGALSVGVGFGPHVAYCASFGDRVRRDVSTAAHPRGRGRFVAAGVPPPEVCPLRPLYRVPIRWEEDVPVRALAVRGRDPDAPLLGRLGAVNIHTVQDAAADAAYNAAVLPLVGGIGAALVVLENDPTFVDTSHGPSAWAQPHLAMPHYPGAQGLLGMVTSAEWGALNALKAAQVGDSLHFGLQLCLQDCATFEGPLLPPRVAGRVLAIHYASPRVEIEDAVPALVAEAEATPGVRLAWAGRTVADVVAVLDDGAMASVNNPLGADGSLLYVLDDGFEPSAALALPVLAAFLAERDAYAVAFFGP